MAVAVVADAIVLPALTKVLDSLTAWWAAQPHPVKVLGLRWGTEYSALVGMIAAQPWDEGCPGICWVRFVSLAESRSNFPASGGNASPCGPALWAVTVEVGVQRCAQQWPQIDGELPTDAEWAALVAQQSADMAVIRQAIRCTPNLAPGQGQNISWGVQTPHPIEGNLTGSTIQVTIPVLDSNNCMGC